MKNEEKKIKKKLIDELLEKKYDKLDLISGGIACRVIKPICKLCDCPPCCWSGPICIND